jgi:hypothetical protein
VGWRESSDPGDRLGASAAGRTEVVGTAKAHGEVWAFGFGRPRFYGARRERASEIDHRIHFSAGLPHDLLIDPRLPLLCETRVARRLSAMRGRLRVARESSRRAAGRRSHMIDLIAVANKSTITSHHLSLTAKRPSLEAYRSIVARKAVRTCHSGERRPLVARRLTSTRRVTLTPGGS